MERQKKPSNLTPENYTRAITSLSLRYSNTSAFPGNNYVGLGEWMLQGRKLFGALKTEEPAAPFMSASEQPHDLVVAYTSGGRKWDVQNYSQEQHEAFSNNTSGSINGSGQIVFLRGFLSPAWVAAVGSKYNLDPEFFRRHMDFLSTGVTGHAYTLPSLMSSSHNIIRLCVSTILHRDDFGQQNIQSQRADQSADMGTYRIQQLGSMRMSCGDSLVRDYSTVCSSFSVVEQWISLCVTKTELGWTVIAWFDHGRALDKSPSGPWASHVAAKATALPILQHHPKMAFRTTTNRREPCATSASEIHQTTTIIPLQYDSMVALVDLARRAPQDPLSMCVPLFAHAAFSEVQFLNLMESRIQIQVNSITLGIPSDALETLQYFSNILSRHSQQLKDSHVALRTLAERSCQFTTGGKAETPPPTSRGSNPPPMESDTVRSSPSGSTWSAFTPNGLLDDYEQLHIRCIHLETLCARGMTLAMNKATIDESRKAIEQSERLKRLTLLATLFIPLNFSSSLFGMNVDLLGQSHVRFWWFFVICVPITLTAYVFYLWNFQTLKQGWKSFRKDHLGTTRTTSDTRGEKGTRNAV